MTRTPFIRDIRLSASEFNKAARHCLRMTEGNKALAKRVLVDGELMQHVAREEGINTARLRQSILTIYDSHKKQLQLKNKMFVMEIEIPLSRSISDKESKALKNRVLQYAKKTITNWSS